VAPDPAIPVADGSVPARLAELAARLDAAGPAIGFPAGSDIDWRPLADLFTRGLLNNLGDPDTDGLYPLHAKDLEREAVDMLADLFRAPTDDRWGYVASGATEATLYGLELARRLQPGAVVLHSAAAHPAVPKAVRLLAMPSVVLRTDEHDAMDYQDLADQVRQRRDRPVVVVANAGTTMTEAVDDVRAIRRVLDDAPVAVGRRFILVDAALSGIPLALLDPAVRPGFDFTDGADCVLVSGHKFLSTPMPCAVVIVKASTRALAPAVSYTGSLDTTIASSRSGHAALAVWYALSVLGPDGLAARAQQCRDLAAHLHDRLEQVQWPVWRLPYAMTVTLAAPSGPVRARWRLANHAGRSHIVCAPGVLRSDLDALATVLADAQGLPPTPDPEPDEGPSPKSNGRRRWLPRQRRAAGSAATATEGDTR
jgi:histidine decarboxylase